MLFTTRKMYQMLETEAYDKTFRTFLESFYAQKPTDKNNVEFLLEKFCALPNIRSTEVFEEFTRNRPIEKHRYVMTQQDFVHFLEQFYFLLTTPNPIFKIKEKQKESIIRGLFEVYSDKICEPGMVTRLNSLFLECRTDLQWIPNELLKQRSNKIQLMADEYNTKFSISDGYSIHTVNRMQQLAEEFDLGVKLEVNIDDIFLHTHENQSIDDYFKKHYIQHFKTYETECIDGLIAHLWNIFINQYRHRFNVNQNNQIEITSENLNLLNEFQSTYLEDLSLHNFIDDATLILKPDNELKQAIKHALIKKLQKDNFFISSVQLNLENSTQIYFIDNHDKKFQRFQEFILVFTNRIQFIEQLSDNFLKHIDILSEYPELIIDILLQNLSLWDSMPRQWRQNHEFILSLIKSLKIQALDEAQQTNLHLKIYQKIIFQNRNYSDFFDGDVTFACQNKSRALAEVKSIFQLQQIAFEISSADICQLNKQGRSIPGLSSSALTRFESGLNKLNLNWEKNEYLKVKERLPALTDRHQSSIFSAEYDQALLLESLHIHNNCIDAFLYFQQHIIVLDLEYCITNNFQNQLQFTSEVFYFWLNTQWNILKLILNLVKTIVIWLIFYKIDEFMNFLSNIIIHSPLLTLTVGFIGSLSLFSYFLEIYQHREPDKFELFFDMILLLIIYSNPYIMVRVSILMSMYQILPYVIACVCKVYNLNWGLQDIQQLIHAYLNIYLNAVGIAFNVINISTKIFFEIVNSLVLISAILTTFIVRGFLNFTQVFQTNRFEQAIPDIENQILRLELSNTISGIQKADILRHIWEHVLIDVDQDKTLTIQNALDIPHVFNFKGQDYQMSFREVATIKRNKFAQLVLDTPPAKSCSFFSSTTSLRLQRIPYDLTFACQ